ncbi:MAG TPA: methyl-accepting chemotaxis protein, partial [bacterium]|nr:methyl-accepting chemotaxis protein [bacterium]
MKFQLKSKLLSGFLAVGLIALAVGIMGYYGLVKTTEQLHIVGKNRLQSVKSLLIINEAFTAIQSSMRTLLIPNIDKERYDNQLKRIDTSRENYGKALKIYESLETSPDEKKVWNEFLTAWENFRVSNLELLKLMEEYHLRGKSNQLYEKIYQASFGENRDLFSKANNLLLNLVDMTDKQADRDVNSGIDTAESLEKTTIITIVLGFLVAVGLGVYLGFTISKSILTTINQLISGAQQVTSASSQITSASIQLSEGAQEQAASIEEMSATMEEMASQSQANAETSKNANK